MAYSTLVMREQKEGETGSARALRLIVLEAAPLGSPSPSGSDAAPGTVLAVENKQLVVQAAGGAIEIRRLQPEGKRAMTVGEFLAGYPVRTGDRFEK
jgi:methionyl-tRNA formyltransferase